MGTWRWPDCSARLAPTRTRRGRMVPRPRSLRLNMGTWRWPDCSARLAPTISSRFVCSKKPVTGLNLLVICVKCRGVRFHRIRDFKQYYFISILPTPQSYSTFPFQHRKPLGNSLATQTTKRSNERSKQERAFRAYPLIEIRQTVPCRAIRGNSVSVNRTLPPSLYTRSPLEDSRLFGPSPWKILATTYEQMGS